MSRIESRQGTQKIFLKIVDGALRQKSAEGLMGAERREWQAGGQSGVSWEIPHVSVTGFIENISFFEGEKDGRRFSTLNIELDENEDGRVPVVTASVSTKYAQDIMKKLPNVDFAKEVRIRPFSFTPEGQEKETAGVEITQADSTGAFLRKVSSYFIDTVFKDGKEQYVPVNGYPTRSKPWSEQNDGERQIYRIESLQFLINFTKGQTIHRIIPPYLRGQGQVDIAPENLDAIPF